jgi:GAF domain-containing protein
VSGDVTYRWAMGAVPREQRLAHTFVELADTLVDDFDVAYFLHMLADRCVELLDVAAAGLMLADPAGRLRVVASSTERARLLELFELQNDEGPCLDCYAGGEPVSESGLGDVGSSSRWPRFAVEARAAGFRSVLALPLRLRGETIGALNVFNEHPEPIPAERRALGQALADVATISLLQDRGTRRREVLASQLQTALNSRVVIEQAKGVLAERHGVDMEEAFRLLRGGARERGHRLSDVAAQVVLGETDFVSGSAS